MEAHFAYQCPAQFVKKNAYLAPLNCVCPLVKNQLEIKKKKKLVRCMCADLLLARTSSTMWNKSDESRHFCLVPNFRGKVFILSPLSMMLP